MVQPEIILPKGVRDTLPERTARRNALVRKVFSVFEKYGYMEVTTPLLEYVDVITQGVGRDLKKRIVKFTDRASGRSVSIRPDFTPQIARIVATHYRGGKKPIRLSYHGSVIRQAEDAGGGQKELYQAGIELIGDSFPQADAEAISIAIEALKSCGLKDFKINVGQVDFVKGMLEELDLSTAQKIEVLDAINKKDISRLADMSNTLKHGDILLEFKYLFYLFGTEEVFEKAEKHKISTKSKKALENVKNVIEVLGKKGYSRFINVDLTEIRGFDYHTGIIFEGFVSGIGSAVCGGGRYDNLLEGFGCPSPATGFAIDLDNLMTAIDRGA